MYYKTTKHNLISLLQNLGALEREQILRFFDDELSREAIEAMLKTLEDYSFLRYDAEKDLYRYHSEPEESDELTSRRVQAFWVPAAARSANILQICRMHYPTQLMFITPKNIVYDVTVCMSENDAMLFRNALRASRNKTEKDIVNHVALVKDRDLGQSLGKYGFDCYCTVQPVSHIVRYEECK